MFLTTSRLLYKTGKAAVYVYQPHIKPTIVTNSILHETIISWKTVTVTFSANSELLLREVLLLCWSM